jgi:hypothetical protein
VLERYRTLAAMTQLAEFTVADLAELSGVVPSTIRTVVKREAGLLERVDTVPRGRKAGRGGRYVRYRLAPGALDSIADELRALEQTGKLNPEVRADATPASDDEVPPGLLAAEHVLLDQLPSADEAAKRELLELASVSIASATESWDLVELRLLGRAGHLHAHAALLLHDLATVELDAPEPGDPATQALFRDLRQRHRLVRRFAAQVPDFDLMDVIDKQLEAVRSLLGAPESASMVVVTPDEGVVPPEIHAAATVVGYEHVELSHFGEVRRAWHHVPSVCVLALPSDSPSAVGPTVERFLTAKPPLTNGLVVSSRFNRTINEVTAGLAVRYIATDGVRSADLGGVFSDIATDGVRTADLGGVFSDVASP